MIDLQQIQARLDHANASIERGDEYDVPVKLLVCDVMDLLKLLTAKSADKPPDTDRKVLVQTGYPFEDAWKDWHTDRFVEGEWQKYGKRWIRAWWELPKGTK